MNIQQVQEKIANLKNQARDEKDSEKNDYKLELLRKYMSNVRKTVKKLHTQICKSIKKATNIK